MVQNDTFNAHLDKMVVHIVSKKREKINDWEVEVPEGTFPGAVYYKLQCDRYA